MKAVTSLLMAIGLILTATFAIAQDDPPAAPGETVTDESTDASAEDKLRDDAIRALMGGDEDEPPADTTDSSPSESADAAATATSRDEAPSRPSRRRRDSGRVPDSAVPVVPVEPDEPTERDVPDEPEASENAADMTTATDDDALPADDLPFGDDALAPSAPLDYRTPQPTTDVEPLQPGAENAISEEPPPATGAPGASSVIIIGLIVLAILLVALAAVVGVMAANRGEAAEPPPAEGASAPADWGYLAAPEAPNISLQTTPFLVGSAAECSLRLADPKASPHHARIDQTETGYTLTDLQSENGTFLNGERITGPVSLRPGDEIAMGDIVVTFEMHG